ncbi:MFS transporter [Pseudonocardia xishanensis]|uniref:MFS transporter n=1 Tax=Pseudonocardia xishanensis TaxID=630995 RepID=A0ABP8S093_9PSEU
MVLKSVATKLAVDVSPLRESVPFRRLWIARTILLLGVGMVAVTVPIQAFALSGSTAVVGVVTAAEGAAFFVGFLFAGVLSDRRDRWALLQIAQVGTIVSFAGLAVNALEFDAVWPIGVLVALNGLSGAVGITAMLAILPGLVEPSRFHAVGGLNTLSLRLGSLVAPVAGGSLVALVGPEWSYGLGALAAVLTFPLVRRPRGVPVPDGPAAGPGAGPVRQFVEGYRFVVRDRVVLGVMGAGVVGMVGGGSIVMIPALVQARIGEGPAAPTVVGLTYAALALGTVVGALSSGWVSSVVAPGRLLLLAMIVCFLFYAGAGAAPRVWLMLLLFVGAGGTNAVEEVLRYALLQQRTPEDLRGRVNSVFAAQNMSGVAVGALVAGGLGTVLEPTTAFWVYNAAMAGVAALVLAGFGELRRHRSAEGAPA